MVAANTALSPDAYAPIAKCKQGELGALQYVPAGDRSRLLPLVEVPGPEKAAALAAAWSDPTHVLLVQPIDLEGLDEDEWARRVEELFVNLRSAGVSAVPVATADMPPVVLDALRDACTTDGRGAALRLDAEDLAVASPGAALAEVSRLLTALGLSEGDCDLVLDAGLVRSGLAPRVTTAESAISVVPSMTDWRNLVVSFSAFPESLADHAAKGSVTPIPREDATAFVLLCSRSLTRRPTFSDYGIGTPFYVDIPWAPIPAIRYADRDNWLIFRGVSKDNRSAQYIELAQKLCADPSYSGSRFSAGDAYFDSVATGSGGPGNPTTYVRAGTSRHVAVVLHRLATLGEP